MCNWSKFSYETGTECPSLFAVLKVPLQLWLKKKPYGSMIGMEDVIHSSGCNLEEF